MSWFSTKELALLLNRVQKVNKGAVYVPFSVSEDGELCASMVTTKQVYAAAGYATERITKTNNKEVVITGGAIENTLDYTKQDVDVIIHRIMRIKYQLRTSKLSGMTRIFLVQTQIFD